MPDDAQEALAEYRVLVFEDGPRRRIEDLEPTVLLFPSLDQSDQFCDAKPRRWLDVAISRDSKGIAREVQWRGDIRHLEHVSGDAGKEVSDPLQTLQIQQRVGMRVDVGTPFLLRVAELERGFDFVQRLAVTVAVQLDVGVEQEFAQIDAGKQLLRLH